MLKSNIANTFDGGFVIKNTGPTHITVDSNPGMGTHLTTDIPGLGQGQGIGIHIPISPTGSVGPMQPLIKR